MISRRRVYSATAPSSMDSASPTHAALSALPALAVCRISRERISAVTGGKSVRAGGEGELPSPASTRIAAERHVTPILPPWGWTLIAAAFLGAHWLVRRRGGLT